MPAELIDGKAIAAKIRAELKDEVEAWKGRVGRSPGLAFVLVGSRRDSATYVRMKKRACEEIGIEIFGAEVDEDITEDELLKIVQDLNANSNVDGIIVQLPLPSHVDETRVSSSVA